MSVHILTTEQENVLCGIGLELGQADEWVHIELAEHGTCSACLAELGDVTTPTGSTPGERPANTLGQCECGNRLTPDDDGQCEWCEYPDEPMTRRDNVDGHEYLINSGNVHYAKCDHADHLPDSEGWVALPLSNSDHQRGI